VAKSVGKYSKRNAGKTRELIRLVKTSYPDAYMVTKDQWRTFPPMYIIMSGEPYQYKNDPVEPDGFHMGHGDTPKEAWKNAWEIVERLTMDKLCK
jgi:hypothetical protein